MRLIRARDLLGGDTFRELDDSRYTVAAAVKSGDVTIVSVAGNDDVAIDGDDVVELVNRPTDSSTAGSVLLGSRAALAAELARHTLAARPGQGDPSWYCPCGSWEGHTADYPQASAGFYTHLAQQLPVIDTATLADDAAVRARYRRAWGSGARAPRDDTDVYLDLRAFVAAVTGSLPGAAGEGRR